MKVIDYGYEEPKYVASWCKYIKLLCLRTSFVFELNEHNWLIRNKKGLLRPNSWRIMMMMMMMMMPKSESSLVCA